MEGDERLRHSDALTLDLSNPHPKPEKLLAFVAVLGWDFLQDAQRPPPPRRADCPKRRPCRRLRCRHHLLVEWTRGGNLKLRRPVALLDGYSCALDVAEEHPDGLTLEQVGGILNITRERCRQVELAARAKFVRAFVAFEAIQWLAATLDLLRH